MFKGVGLGLFCGARLFHRVWFVCGVEKAKTMGLGVEMNSLSKKVGSWVEVLKNLFCGDWLSFVVEPCELKHTPHQRLSVVAILTHEHI